jgi:hypothetical protein
MSCHESIRESLGAKLDGWEAYVRAIGAQIEDVDGSDALDRVQVSKRRLRESLERLESETNEAETLANAARADLHRASTRLRKELDSPRPDCAARYAGQRQAIMAAVAATENEMNTISTSLRANGASRLRATVERTMRGMVKLEAELEAGEIQFSSASPGSNDFPPRAEREIASRLRALAAAIAIARKLPADSAKLAEAEIASGIGRIRQLFSALSR